MKTYELRAGNGDLLARDTFSVVNPMYTYPPAILWNDKVFLLINAPAHPDQEAIYRECWTVKHR